MKTKLTQSLPLLGTFLALIIGGAVLFKIAPADAILDVSEDTVPPADNVNSDPSILQFTDPDTATSDADKADDTGMVDGDATTTGAPDADPEPVDPRVIMEPTMGTVTDTSVESSKTVTGIYAEANEKVVLADHYLNDVYVAGNEITVTGTIEGDLFAAGEHVTVEGTVMGSVRAASANVEIHGAVGRNVVAFTGDLYIAESSHIGADVVAFAENVNVRAMVMGNVSGAASDVYIDSVVEGQVNLHKVGELVFGPNAYVMGDVNYSAPSQAKLYDGATVLGELNYTQAVKKEHSAAAFDLAGMVIKVAMTILGWIGYLILGIVLIKCFPNFTAGVANSMRTRAGASFGFGVLVMLALPIALAIIAVTVLGLPLAFAGLLGYILMLMAAKVYVGLGLGKVMMPNSKGMVGPFILGFSLIYLVYSVIGWFGLPGMIVSGLISSLAMAWALGAIVLQHKHRN